MNEVTKTKEDNETETCENFTCNVENFMWSSMEAIV